MPPSGEVSPDLFREAEEDRRLGLAGYRRFRERLFTKIGPTQADAARADFYHSAILLWPVLAASLALTFLSFSFSAQLGPSRFNVISDVQGALLILAALVLGGWFHIPTAGRLLLTSYGVILTLWIVTLQYLASARKNSVGVATKMRCVGRSCARCWMENPACVSSHVQSSAVYLLCTGNSRNPRR